ARVSHRGGRGARNGGAAPLACVFPSPGGGGGGGGGGLRRQFDDGQDQVRIQAGPADEGAVHVRLRQERRDIFRLHAAAVLNRKRPGRFLAKLFRRQLAKEDMRFLGLLRGGVVPGADGPDRLVGYHHAGGLVRRRPCRA